MKYTSEIIDYAVTEYQKGRYVKDIAKELSLNPPTLSKKMKEVGCQIKKNVPSYKMNEEAFSIIDSEESAYWLGYVFASGTVSKADNRITGKAKDSDYEHLLRFRDFLKSDSPIEKINRENSCRIRFSSVKMKSDLLLHGHGYEKEAEYSCPFEEQVEDGIFRHFVRGYVDGNGHLGMTHNDMSYPALMIIGNEEFLNQVVLRMKWEQGFYFYESKGQFTLQCKYPLIALNSMKELYVSSEISLDRKKKHFLELSEAYRKRMKGGC